MKLKNKKVIFWLLFFWVFYLCVFELPASFNYFPLDNRINEDRVETANGTSIEGIVNGGFETGDLTGWLTGGDYPAMVGTGTYLAHTGTYGCKVSGYGGGYYHHSWVEQNLTEVIIFADNIVSFSFWRKTDKTVRVTVTYWDDTTTIHEFYNLNLNWEQHFVTGLAPEKRLKKIRLETLVDGVNIGGIDDVTITYIPLVISEGVINGGFETGDLTGWVTGGDYPAMVGTGTYLAHTGTYGCKVSGYGGGYYHHSWVEQNLTDVIIFAENIVSFSFWRKTDKTVRVTVTYWDDTTTIHEFYNLNLNWEQHYITGMTLGKRLKKIRLETLVDGVNIGGIDDITLTYVHLFSLEGISNGGFETGDLTGWVTGGDYPAMVGTGTYLAHTGTYGCKVSGYGGGYYHHSWVEQNLTDSPIYSNYVESFSFWRKTDKTVRVTVTYWDDTTTIHEFYNLNLNWEQHYITGLTPGKRLKKIRLETLVDGVNIGGIDDITLTYYHLLFSPKAPTLSAISPNPDNDGNINLNWDDVPFTDYYTVYRYTSFITELNGSLTNLGTTISSSYLDSDLSEGMYYYVVTSTNASGMSDISNCESVEVDLPAPSAPILADITPDPDPDGVITLDWNDVVNADTYTIYRYTSLITELNGSVTTVDTSSISTYDDLGLDEGIYYYVITATSETGTSEISNCESVEVDLPGPNAPILVDITPDPDPDGVITLDWDDVPFADNYTVYRHTSYITELNGAVTNLGTTISSTYTDSILSEGIYYYVITATNETGTSEISNCESVEVDLPGPDAPILAEITPDPDSDGDIDLDWEDVLFADYYTVYRHTSYITELNSSVTNLGTTASLGYTDLGLSEGTYYYVVTATNGTGTSVISNCESVVVDFEEQIPEIPGYNLSILILLLGVISVLLLLIKHRKH